MSYEIPNRDQRDPLLIDVIDFFGETYISLRQHAGSLSFSHPLNVNQARDMANALIKCAAMAEAVERAAS